MKQISSMGLAAVFTSTVTMKSVSTKMTNCTDMPKEMIRKTLQLKDFSNMTATRDTILNALNLTMANIISLHNK